MRYLAALLALSLMAFCACAQGTGEAARPEVVEAEEVTPPLDAELLSPEEAAEIQSDVEAADAAAAPTPPPDATGDLGEGARRGDLSDLFENAEPLVRAIETIEQYLEAEPEALEPPLEGGEPMELDVRECVDLAIERNARISVSEDEVEAARARIRQARSARLPQVNANYAITRTEYNEPELNQFQRLLSGLGGGLGGGIGGIGGIGGGIGGGTGDPLLDIALPIVINAGISSALESLVIDTAPDDTLETSQVEFSQVIYSGGRIAAAIRAAEFLAESQEWQREVTTADVEYEAKQAFYDALLARALVRVAEESVRTYQRTLTDAQEMFDVGMISNFEVLRAQTELGARQAEHVAAENGYRLALTNLRRILYLPQDTPVVLEPLVVWDPPREGVDTLVALAYEQRPEIRVLELGIEAAEQNLRAVRGQYIPQVAANANYSNTDGGGITIPDGWQFSVGSQWEVIAGGRRRGEREEAQAEVSRLEHQLEDLEQLVQLDVTSAFIQIQDAMAQVRSERQTVELAREGLRLALLRFQEGVGIQAEVLDAELALTSAQTNLVQALRDYAVAQSALERATGGSWSTTAPGEEVPAAETAAVEAPATETSAAEGDAASAAADAAPGAETDAGDAKMVRQPRRVRHGR